jgi:hypothetical protein
LTSLGGDLYQAALPAAGCTDTPEFYISAQSDLGTTVLSPGDAPTGLHATLVGTYLTIMLDDFQSDLGWTAANLGASSGDWQRGTPVNDSGWDYDPITDSDGSGQCYLTQNETGNTDVDDGAVELTSPAIDMTAGNVTISYDYFLRLTETAGGVDRLLVEIDSNDGAGPWTEIARHDTNGGLGWRSHVISQADLDGAGVSLSSTMRLRFTTNDANPQSINESGLDAFLVSSFSCQVATPPTITGASSVVTHGSAGDFESMMSDRTIIEHRNNGATELVVRFDMAMDPATTIPANVAATGLVHGAYTGAVGTSLAGGDQLTITFDPALEDVDRYVVALSGMTSLGGAESADPTFEVIALEGDVNHDLATNTTDASILKLRFGLAVDGTTWVYDYNNDGEINTTDFSQVKLKFGNSAP